MVPLKELSFNTFFTDLIFYPEHAVPQDQKKALALSIALGIFSLGIFPLIVGVGWSVDKAITWLKEKLTYTEKKTDESFRANFSNKSQNISINQTETENVETIATKKLDIFLPLDKTGRLRHGANTCFLAAAIQLIRQIPLFNMALENPSRIRKNESKDKFELREKIRIFLFQILLRSNSGKEVSANEMDAFGALLHQYDKQIPAPGKYGATISAIEVIFEILSIEEVPYSISDYFVDNYCSMWGEEEDKPYNLLTSQIKIFPWDIPRGKIPLTYENSDAKYHLVGVTSRSGNHAVAYVKDLRHPSSNWVYLDDMQPTRIAPEDEPDRKWANDRVGYVFLRDDNIHQVNQNCYQKS